MDRTQNGGRPDDESERLAPVIPLFAGPGRQAADATRNVGPGSWHTTWTADEPAATIATGRAAHSVHPGDADDSDADVDLEAAAADAEKRLLKKLRTRSLSVREARAVVADPVVDAEVADAIIERFVHRGYLDDARLAEQLVHAGVDRKGQGRQAISQSLAARGIPRDVIDLALAELPDDDAKRALEFARQKARSMRDLDRDTALRRLAGQLARRGYGSAALSAARQALDEQARPPRSGGVRFTEG